MAVSFLDFEQPIAELEATVGALRRLPPRAATEYFAAVARLLADDPRAALTCAQRASNNPTSCSRPTSGVRPPRPAAS